MNGMLDFQMVSAVCACFMRLCCSSNCCSVTVVLFDMDSFDKKMFLLPLEYFIMVSVVSVLSCQWCVSSGSGSVQVNISEIIKIEALRRN